MPHTLIIGCPGSGKSTFARKYAQLTGKRLVHLDMINHLPDRTTVSREEFDRQLMELLRGEDCIIDGNYRRTMRTRMEFAERVFLFDLPTCVCVEGITCRVGTARPDMPWVEETLDTEFLEFVQGFRESNLPDILEILADFPNISLTVFHSREEADEYLRSLSFE